MPSRHGWARPNDRADRAAKHHGTAGDGDREPQEAHRIGGEVKERGSTGEKGPRPKGGHYPHPPGQMQLGVRRRMFGLIGTHELHGGGQANSAGTNSSDDATGRLGPQPRPPRRGGTNPDLELEPQVLGRNGEIRVVVAGPVWPVQSR